MPTYTATIATYTNAITTYASTATTSTAYWSYWDNWDTVDSNQAFNNYLATRALHQQQNALATQMAQEWVNRRPVSPPTNRARLRARSLLRMLLTAEQWQSFVGSKMFEIEGRSGQRYRIHHGRIANIEVPDLGHRLCVHPDPSVPMPVEDVLVSQVLHLRDDDLALVSRANVHPGLGGPRG